MAKELFCDTCGVLVATLEKGSTIKKNVHITCDKCFYGEDEDLSEFIGYGNKSDNSSVEWLKSMFGMKT